MTPTDEYYMIVKLERRWEKLRSLLNDHSAVATEYSDTSVGEWRAGYNMALGWAEARMEELEEK
jgi:hypothetical protein